MKRSMPRSAPDAIARSRMAPSGDGRSPSLSPIPPRIPRSGLCGVGTTFAISLRIPFIHSGRFDPMPSFLAATLLLLSAGPAPLPGSVNGTLHERALMKSVQVIYLERVDGDAATAPIEGATMNQKGNTYLPHVLPVTVGTKVAFQTMDPELHNIYAKAGEDVLFNTALPSGAPVWNKVMKNAGVVALTCNIHSEMSAFIVVLQNRFFTL